VGGWLPRKLREEISRAREAVRCRGCNIAGKECFCGELQDNLVGKVWEERDFGLTLKEAGLMLSAVLFAKRKESLVDRGMNKSSGLEICQT
jgi:hypothetical protein